MKRFLFLVLIALQWNLSADTPVPAEAALNRSMDFARRHEMFKNAYFKEHEQEFLKLVKQGQSPKVLFISCSDSRVIPELISLSPPGDLFVIRTAGNFVPTYDPEMPWDGVSATIQYGVEVLGVSDIIVCGHSHCGAIKGVFSDSDTKLDLLNRWLRFGQTAKQWTLESVGPDISQSDLIIVGEHLSVVSQIEHLLSFPFIKQRVEKQQLYLHGWYFCIETGQVSYYDPEKKEFRLLTTQAPPAEEAIPAKRVNTERGSVLTR